MTITTDDQKHYRIGRDFVDAVSDARRIYCHGKFTHYRGEHECTCTFDSTLPGEETQRALEMSVAKHGRRVSSFQWQNK